MHGGNGHRWTALLELRRKHIEIASDADRLTRWFRSGPSDNPSRRERHQPRHGKSGPHETRRWREKDSNPRSPARETTLRDRLLIEEVRFAEDSPVGGGDSNPRSLSEREVPHAPNTFLDSRAPDGGPTSDPPPVRFSRSERNSTLTDSPRSKMVNVAGSQSGWGKDRGGLNRVPP